MKGLDTLIGKSQHTRYPGIYSVVTTFSVNYKIFAIQFHSQIICYAYVLVPNSTSIYFLSLHV